MSTSFDKSFCQRRAQASSTAYNKEDAIVELKLTKALLWDGVRLRESLCNRRELSGVSIVAL